MRRDVFQAIADPVRRDIIDLVAKQPMNVNSIANSFEISRPAVSKHVKILKECGLLKIEKRGRERYCQIQPESLFQVANWVDQYRTLWEQKLDNLEAYLIELQKTPKENG